MAANLDWGTTVNVNGVGSFSASIKGQSFKDFDKIVEEMHGIVRGSRDNLLSILRTSAPKKTGDLRRGIVASPGAESTAVPGKIVYDVYMDDAMNSTFVKYSKSGKRYYYPASQEYGFTLKNGGYKPGLYYMRDTSIRYAATFEQNVSDGLEKTLEAL